MYITIAIPFYNEELFLLDAIKSVFAQTHTEWELLLIDDGSTDNSLSIAKSIKDPRVHVYSDGKNKKLASRLNEIVKLAKYDIVARMDADDLMSPYRIEKQVEILEKNSEFDLVSTGIYSINDSFRPISVRCHLDNNINLYNLLFRRGGAGIVHASILAKKEFFVRNPYNESYPIAQDFGLWIECFMKGDLNIFIMKEPLYFYREEGSLNLKKILLAYKFERIFFKKYLKKYKFILIIRSYLKSLIYIIVNFFGFFETLIKRRNYSSLSKEHKEKYYSDLAIINLVNLKELFNTK
ncbi:MAG: glycosyltransferase family 2 protein [Pelagibacterales bacterium]|nr:glycosyltransferase family 2 protein [Pelagibacterales bacterium]